MKCPRCWTDKAYRHRRQGWKSLLLASLTLVSMKCHHCYHKFHVCWLSTVGQTMMPPVTGDGRRSAASEVRDRGSPAMEPRLVSS